MNVFSQHARLTLWNIVEQQQVQHQKQQNSDQMLHDAGAAHHLKCFPILAVILLMLIQTLAAPSRRLLAHGAYHETCKQTATSTATSTARLHSNTTHGHVTITKDKAAQRLGQKVQGAQLRSSQRHLQLSSE